MLYVLIRNEYIRGFPSETSRITTSSRLLRGEVSFTPNNSNLKTYSQGMSTGRRLV